MTWWNCYPIVAKAPSVAAQAAQHAAQAAHPHAHAAVPHAATGTKLVVHAVRHPVKAYHATGKAVRHALRHRAGMTHRAARRVWTTLVCLPFALPPLAYGMPLVLPWAPNAGLARPAETSGSAPVSVPEPASMAVFALGAAGVLVVRRRR